MAEVENGGSSSSPTPAEGDPERSADPHAGEHHPGYDRPSALRDTLAKAPISVQALWIAAPGRIGGVMLDAALPPGSVWK